jgi:hypothetical protein
MIPISLFVLVLRSDDRNLVVERRSPGELGAFILGGYLIEKKGARGGDLGRLNIGEGTSCWRIEG